MQECLPTYKILLMKSKLNEVPVAPRSKAQVYGLSFAEFLRSNAPTGGIDVCLL